MGQYYKSSFREVILFFLSNLLIFYKKNNYKLLWYIENIVLSARFQQKIKKYFCESSIKKFATRRKLWIYLSNFLKSQKNSSYVVFEFGVAHGNATIFWSKRNINFIKWLGFDTFEGLPSDWIRDHIPVMKVGTFAQTENSKLKIPEINSKYDIIWKIGLIEETLTIDLIKEYIDYNILLIIDVDLYSPTKHIIETFTPYFKFGDLIYFDEAFDPWNEGKVIFESDKILNDFIVLGRTADALLLKHQ